MNQFDVLLIKFDKILKTYNEKNYNRLKPPLQAKEIDSLLEKIGVQDEYIKMLYSWKNGFDNTEEPLPMIFSFQCTMLSLEMVLHYKESNYYSEFTKMKDLLMMFENSDGEGFLFNSRVGKNYGKIHLFSTPLLSIESPYPYFDSLSSMLETSIQQYEKGGLIYDELNDYLNTNTDINIEVYEKLNPESNFYNHT